MQSLGAWRGLARAGQSVCARALSTSAAALSTTSPTSTWGVATSTPTTRLVRFKSEHAFDEHEAYGGGGAMEPLDGWTVRRRLENADDPAWIAQQPQAPQSLYSDTAPRSLARPRQPRWGEEGHAGGEISGWFRTFLRFCGYYSRESVLIEGSKRAYAMIAERTMDPLFVHDLGLENLYRDKHLLTSLHVWMVLRRVRGQEAASDRKKFSDAFYLRFNDRVEKDIYDEGVRVRVSTWLATLENAFFTLVIQCDRSLDGAEGAEPMDETLLKYVYAGDEAKREFARALARYIRREVASLELTDEESVLRGDFQFNSATNNCRFYVLNPDTREYEDANAADGPAA